MPKKGTSLDAGKFELGNTDDFLDLLATVAYDHAQDENGRAIRWKIDGQRRADGLAPENISRSSQLDWLIDRFEVNRIQ